MRKPNPMLLDILYRSGAYPFDDVVVDGDDIAGVWHIPNTGSLPVVIVLRGNGASTSALSRELKRLAKVLSWHHHSSVPCDTSWTYQIEVHIESAVSRILSRTLEARDESEISAMQNAFVFIPWFDPDEKYRPAYTGLFDGSMLPDLGADEAQEKDWASMPAPDVGADFDLPSFLSPAPADKLPTFDLDDLEDDDFDLGDEEPFVGSEFDVDEDAEDDLDDNDEDEDEDEDEDAEGDLDDNDKDEDEDAEGDLDDDDEGEGENDLDDDDEDDEDLFERQFAKPTPPPKEVSMTKAELWRMVKSLGLSEGLIYRDCTSAELQAIIEDYDVDDRG